MVAAYWFLFLIFLVLSLIFMFLVVGRRRAVNGSLPGSAKLLAVAPAAVSAGLGIDGHPAMAIGISILVVLLSLWWLSNMAKRDAGR